MFTAVIPVRAGSRRIKDKNIAPFGSSNLLLHKIRQLKQVPSLDAIVVSSDSEAMLKMADEERVLTHRRGAAFSDEESKTFGEVVRHICENVPGDHVVWAQCTSPLVTADIYEDAIQTYLRNLGLFDSLASVEAFRRHLWDNKGPVNYERGRRHPPSQKLPQMYFVTGVFIAPRVKMIEWNHNIGANPYKYILSKVHCLDIDDELDLELARLWHDKACNCKIKEMVHDH